MGISTVSLRLRKKKNCYPTQENDELVLGIREKVTRFILMKVENELNKLQNHDYEVTPKTNVYEQRQEYYNQQQSYIPIYNQWPSSYCQDWTNVYNQYIAIKAMDKKLNIVKDTLMMVKIYVGKI